MDDEIIFYGAGVEAKYWLLKYKALGIEPICFCDRNPELFNTYIMGIICIPIDKALKLYPDSKIVVTPRYPLRFHIIEELSHKYGIQQSRILNYEPYRKMVSCHYLHEYVDFHFTKTMQVCCGTMKTREYPKVLYDDDMDSSIDKLIRLKEDILEKLNDGRESETACSGCSELVNDYWPEDTRLRQIAYSVGGGCQFNCMYCFSPARHSMIKKTWEEKVSLKEFLERLEKKGALHPDVMIEMGPGEITIIPERKELFEILENYDSCILTNAGVYSKDIEKLVLRNRTRLLVSVDAGTRESFLRIKGIDAFEIVVNNLKEYAKNGALIELKYIFMSGINDNSVDIKGFVDLAKEIGAYSVQISHDFQCGGSDIKSGKLIDCMFEMANYAQEKGLEVGVRSIFSEVNRILK